jgi:hypothetical protein
MPFRCYAVCHNLCTAYYLHSGSSYVLLHCFIHYYPPFRPHSTMLVPTYSTWQYMPCFNPPFVLHISFHRLCCPLSLGYVRSHSVIHSFQPCKSPSATCCCYARRCGSLAAFKALLDNTSAHASMLKQNLSLRSLFVRCTSGITQPTPLAVSFLPLCFSHSARTGEPAFLPWKKQMSDSL